MVNNCSTACFVTLNPPAHAYKRQCLSATVSILSFPRDFNPQLIESCKVLSTSLDDKLSISAHNIQLSTTFSWILEIINYLY